MTIHKLTPVYNLTTNFADIGAAHYLTTAGLVTAAPPGSPEYQNALNLGYYILHRIGAKDADTATRAALHTYRRTRTTTTTTTAVATMTLNHGAIRALLGRLQTVRDRARSFQLDDERSDHDRAVSLQASARVMHHELVAGWAMTLDELPALAADAIKTISLLRMAWVADPNAEDR